MNLESAGRVVDEEIRKLADYLENKFKPATKSEIAGLFRRVAQELNKLAENLDKENR